MTKTIISVLPCKKSYHFQQKSLNQLLSESGLKKWRCLRSASLYALEGTLTKGEIEFSARALFSDPITEKFFINDQPSRPGIFFSDIWFRRGVTDPVAESILKALQDLKIHSCFQAYSGTRYEWFCKNSSDSLPQSVRELREFVTLNLLNPLIQECRILSYGQSDSD